MRRVHVYSLRPQRIEERLPASSHLAAWRELSVLARVHAQVLEVSALEGSAVTKGQLLVQLDDKQAKLELAAAKAKEKEISDLEAEARIGLDEAKLHLQLALKDLRKASNDRERSRAQAKEELVSASQLEADELAYERAANAAELQRIKLRRAKLGVTKLESQKQSARIQREIKERMLEDYQVEAPFDGLVAESFVKGGEWISPQSPLLKLSDRRRLVAYFARPQKEIGSIRKELDVEFSFDAFPGQVFHGQIAFISPIVDQQTGTFRARAEVADPQKRLRAGMFTRAEIVTAVSPKALMIPRTAIFYEDQRPFTFVARDRIAQRIPIEAGIATKGAVEARNLSQGPEQEGFRAGDLVIVVGGENLRPGQAVEVAGYRDAKGLLLATEPKSDQQAPAHQDG